MVDCFGDVWLLLIDTCGSVGSVALARGGDVSAEVMLPERMASAAVLPAVRELLLGQAVRVRELGGCGVVSGPGSFTGLRVGLSVAKGICEAADLPLAAVSRLAVLADVAGLQEGFAVLWAGPGQMYVGTVEGGRCVTEQMMTAAASASMLHGRRVVYTEDGLCGVLGEAAAFADLVRPTAKDALRLVRASLAQGGIDRAEVDANYVRDEASIYPRAGAAR